MQSKSFSIPLHFLSSSSNLSHSILVWSPTCLFASFIIFFSLCFSFIASHLLSSLCCCCLSSTFFIPPPPWPFQCKNPLSSWFPVFNGCGLETEREKKRKKCYLRRKILLNEWEKIRKESKSWQSKAVCACMCEQDLRPDDYAAF